MAFVRYTGIFIYRRSSIRYTTGYSKWHSLLYMYVISGDQYRVFYKVV